MSNTTSNNSDQSELRELSMDEIESTSGAGFFSWLRSIFGGNDPQPARGPFNPSPHK